MIEIELCPAQVLHALARFANPKDLRSILRGVWVESSPQGLILWATNGQHHAALRLGDAAACEPFNLLIPCDTIAQLPAKNSAAVALIPGEPPALRLGGSQLTWHDEQLTPPNWRRATATQGASPSPAQFDQRLLEPFVKMAEALGKKKDVAGWLRVTPFGQACARVHIPERPEFFGAVMPLRPDVVALAPGQRFTPEWAASGLHARRCGAGRGPRR